MKAEGDRCHSSAAVQLELAPKPTMLTTMAMLPAVPTACKNLAKL